MFIPTLPTGVILIFSLLEVEPIPNIILPETLPLFTIAKSPATAPIIKLLVVVAIPMVPQLTGLVFALANCILGADPIAAI